MFYNLKKDHPISTQMKGWSTQPDFQLMVTYSTVDSAVYGGSTFSQACKPGVGSGRLEKSYS